MRNHFKKALYLVLVLWFSAVYAGSYEDFFLAVSRDDGDTVSALIKRGFDPNARSPEGQTALHLALRDQSPRVAAAVWASADLDVDAPNASAETPLMMAALRGDLEWARRLLLPAFRWLFEYSQSNFVRQQRVNHVLFACVQQLAIENAALRRDLERRDGRTASHTP